MEIASLLWSISCLSIAAHGDVGPTKRMLCALTEAPVVRQGEWHGHSLCLLANALYPVRCDLDPSLWAEIEDRWLQELSRLVDALTGFERLPVDPGRFCDGLQATGCFHAGPHYTQRLLAELGMTEAPPDFTAEARDIVEEARSECDSGWSESGIANAKNMPDVCVVSGILCVMHFSLVVNGKDPVVESRRLFATESHDGPRAEATFKGAEALVPTPLAHDRSGHAEFLALSHVVAAAAALVGQESLASLAKHEIVGVVRLYVTHHPCLSCVGAMCQFRAALPHVDVELSYDWRPAAGR